MVETIQSLEGIAEPTPGQIVCNEQDGKFYRWDPIEGWKLFQFDGDIKMTAYDINKQIIGQLPIMDKTAIAEKKKTIREFVSNKQNQFYMLLCREVNYYTVFAIDVKLADECVDDVVIECAADLGLIKSIEPTEDGNAIEIWVSNSEDTYAMYFFPYDAGVIVCG